MSPSAGTVALLVSTCWWLPTAASATTVDFSKFPGTDNLLGTGDDVSVNPTFANSVHFTNEFRNLVGGGFIVNSPVPGGAGQGAIDTLTGNSAGNLLVQSRPDVSSTAYSFSSVEILFMAGIIPIAFQNVSLDIVDQSGTHTVRFYDLSGTLLNTQSITPNNMGSYTNIAYANPAGIAKVVTLHHLLHRGRQSAIHQPGSRTRHGRTPGPRAPGLARSPPPATRRLKVTLPQPKSLEAPRCRYPGQSAAR